MLNNPFLNGIERPSQKPVVSETSPGADPVDLVAGRLYELAEVKPPSQPMTAIIPLASVGNFPQRRSGRDGTPWCLCCNTVLPPGFSPYCERCRRERRRLTVAKFRADRLANPVARVSAKGINEIHQAADEMAQNGFGVWSKTNWSEIKQRDIDALLVDAKRLYAKVKEHLPPATDLSR